ncbi:hypothetical protein KI387_018465, partial [Taxus chinensis]
AKFWPCEGVEKEEQQKREDWRRVCSNREPVQQLLLLQPPSPISAFPTSIPSSFQ